MNITRHLLTAGIAMPFIYFFTLYGFGLLYPDLNYMAQVPSDLGADGAPYAYAGAFNFGLILAGITSCMGAIGLFQALRAHGLKFTLPFLTALTLFSFGISYILFGYYPLPDVRHGEASIFMLSGVFTPLLGALALRSLDKMGKEWKILLVASVSNIILFIIIMFSDVVVLFSTIVDEAHFGLWLRIVVMIFFPALGYLCWAVRRLGDKNPNPLPPFQRQSYNKPHL